MEIEYIHDKFSCLSHDLKQLGRYQKCVLLNLCEPHLYKPKSESTMEDMRLNNNGACFFPMTYKDEICFAVIYLNEELPLWLDDSDETKVLISKDIFDDCKYYDFGNPSFFNLKGYFTHKYHIKFFWRCGIPDAKCQIEIEGKDVTGTISNIEFTKFDLTLDMMGEFKKRVEISESEMIERSFIREKKLSEDALQIARAELKKLFIDYRFFFEDYKDEIKLFFKEYFESYKSELEQINKGRSLSKKVIRRKFESGEITESEMERLLEKRQAACERYSFIMTANLEKSLREYSKANWGREVKYQKYYTVINNYLLAEYPELKPL